MDSSLRLLLIAAFVALTAACTHSPLRLPQSTQAKYDPTKTRLIRMTAENGIFFQIPDSVLRDAPSRSAGEQCRKVEEAPWVEQIYSVLSVLDREPQLMSKIHVIEFRRGDKPGAEISKDLDDAVALVVFYAKKETRQKITGLSEIPCANNDMSLVGKDLVLTSFEWPTPAQIALPLANLPARPSVERLNVDRRFAVWLADRLTLFRLTPELAFEKDPSGKPLLPEAFSLWASEVGTTPPAALEYWLKEISQKSKIGASVKFFALKRDTEGNVGITVDSVGRFARRMGGFSEPTSPFVSYRLDNGTFAISGLRELEPCLSDLISSYRNPLSSVGNFDMNPESFLSPGHACAAGNR